jgi:hypothetical protein
LYFNKEPSTPPTSLPGNLPARKIIMSKRIKVVIGLLMIVTFSSYPPVKGKGLLLTFYLQVSGRGEGDEVPRLLRLTSGICISGQGKHSSNGQFDSVPSGRSSGSGNHGDHCEE